MVFLPEASSRGQKETFYPPVFSYKIQASLDLGLNFQVMHNKEMAYVIELVNNNIKTLIMTVFHMFKKLEEILNISREIEDIKDVQIKLLDVKILMS